MSRCLACVVFVLAACDTPVRAESFVHVLVAQETRDTQVSQACQIACSQVGGSPAHGALIQRTLTTLIPARRLSEGEIGQTIREILLGTSSLPMQQNGAAMRRRPVAADDTILFVYSGHGFADQNRERFLKCDGVQLQRELLATELRRANCRLTILATDMCAEFIKFPPVAAAPGAAPATARVPPGISRLFLESRGFVDVCSSDLDEKAWPCVQQVQGTLFGQSWSESVFAVKEDSAVTWQSFLTLVRDKTRKSAEALLQNRSETVFLNNGEERRLKSQTVSVLRNSATIPRSSQEIMTLENEVVEINPKGGRIAFYLERQRINVETGVIVSTNRTQVQPPPGSAEFASLMYASDGTPFWTYGLISVPAHGVEKDPGKYPDPGIPNPVSRRAPLGITVKTCEDGVHIESVSANSPASRCFDAATNERITLEKDDHIQSVNGIVVTEHLEAVRLVGLSPVNLTLEIKDGRNGKIRRLSTRLEEVQQNNAAKPPLGPVGGNVRRVPLGVMLRTCDEGVHIDKVTGGTPATRCIDNATNESITLEVGDHVVSVNGVAVSSQDDAVRLVGQSPSRLTLEIKDQRTKKIRRLVTQLTE